MSRKAVDVVLLPSPDMIDKAIEANRRLVEKFSRKIVLDRENCLPHISLAMGCIEEEAIPEIAGILKKIAKENTVRELEIAGVRVSENSFGERVLSFEIKKTERLQRLHERVLDEVGPYLSYDVTADMIYNCGEVAESTLMWIRDYREKSSFEKFWPHITIGYGMIEDIEFPKRLKVSQLTLCHLGNHCTCRKILVEAAM